MKNKLTRKLMLSAFTLLFAVISLGASTYAWFVMSEDAKVSSFSGTVTSGDSGLEIQVTDVTATTPTGTWRSTELNLVDDFKAATQVVFDALQNQKDFDGTAFKNLDKTKAGVPNSTTAEDGKVTHGNYVAFRLWFRLSDTTGIPENGKPVYLTDYDLTTTDSTVLEWYVNKEYKNNIGESVKVGQDDVKYLVSDAARLAIQYDNNTQIYEADNIKEDAFRSYGIGTKGAYDYYNNVKPGVLDKLYPNDYYSAAQSLNSALPIGTLKADDEKTTDVNENLFFIDVYIWIDGWDQECINAIFTQQLNILLKFSLVNELQETKGEQVAQG